ncbi:MAG TPA: RNA polymerase sigma factor SigM [Acidimicrobiia bacterium]|nr:RNA polymerase sigma factor SigM [Acidimicrobiia bacterium]
MIETDDRDLLARFRQGDRRAFDELMRRHEDRVFAVCLRIMRHREAALDAVQDTFLTAFRKADQFRGDAQFSTWLYRIAVNTCYDHLRRSKRRPAEPLPEEHDPPDAGARDALEAAELRPDLNAALAAIGEDFRAAIVLADVQGLPLTEVADILGVAEGTVKSRLHRGRRQLAQILGNREDWG